jgi:hypothetical protein
MNYNEIESLVSEIDHIQTVQRCVYESIQTQEGILLLIYAWMAVLGKIYVLTGGFRRLKEGSHPTGTDLLFYVYLACVLESVM